MMKKSPEQMGFIDNEGWVEVDEGFGCLEWIRNVLKITAEVGLIGLETALLIMTIVPTMMNMSNPNTSVNQTNALMNSTNGNNTLDSVVYKKAAISYIAFYFAHFALNLLLFS